MLFTLLANTELMVIFFVGLDGYFKWYVTAKKRVALLSLKEVYASRLPKVSDLVPGEKSLT